jgi:hypothetical protein
MRQVGQDQKFCHIVVGADTQYQPGPPPFSSMNSTPANSNARVGTAKAIGRAQGLRGFARQTLLDCEASKVEGK